MIALSIDEKQKWCNFRKTRIFETRWNRQHVESDSSYVNKKEVRKGKSELERLVLRIQVKNTRGFIQVSLLILIEFVLVFF